MVDRQGALCLACWRETPFLRGHGCDACAAPLVGEGDGTADVCDECLERKRPWGRARAAMAYGGAGWRLVLGLKHGDRTDLCRPAAGWIHSAARDIIGPATLLIPVPIHWTRRIRRRYNQSAELVRALAPLAGCRCLCDALVRTRATPKQDGLGVDARFRNQAGTIALRRAAAPHIEDAKIVLIDDVMTSGAILAAAAEALLSAGAASVDCGVLARAVKSS